MTAFWWCFIGVVCGFVAGITVTLLYAALAASSQHDQGDRP